jgi:hypothetical protein
MDCTVCPFLYERQKLGDGFYFGISIDVYLHCFYAVCFPFNRFKYLSAAERQKPCRNINSD